MRVKVLIGLLTLSTLWSLVTTLRYWQLKNNPSVIAVTSETGKDLLPTEKLGETEKLSFLRQYLDRYFNYDSNNFWQSQTSLAFLMSPSLSEERIQEVRRLREKIQQKNLSQKGRLLSLQKLPSQLYQAKIALLTKEGAAEAPLETLFVTIGIALQDTERTLENPWGSLVDSMNFKNSLQPFDFKLQLNLKPQTPLLVVFPCALQNVENTEPTLKTKITTFSISDLQLTLTENTAQVLTVLASCKDKEYRITLSTTAALAQDLFFTITSEMGQNRKKSGRPRKKDAYERTIEKVLGIELEN